MGGIMVFQFSKDQNKVPFQVKMTDVMSKDIDLSDVANVWIVFYKSDGTRIEKAATLEDDPENPGQAFNIVGIVGNGIDDVITVELDSADIAKLADGELITIAGTNNFDISNVPITKTDATHFTYNLGVPGNVSSESTGTATTPGEKLITYVDESEEILDKIFHGEFSGKAKLNDGTEFENTEKALYTVN